MHPARLCIKVEYQVFITRGIISVTVTCVNPIFATKKQPMSHCHSRVKIETHRNTHPKYFPRTKFSLLYVLRISTRTECSSEFLCPIFVPPCGESASQSHCLDQTRRPHWSSQLQVQESLCIYHLHVYASQPGSKICWSSGPQAAKLE